ncbi:MAG: hypothetical protein HQK54_05395 [Oligoflexales bacterium]|nr:hypothetical protein [Oligoflexales bacterium]
MMTRQEALTILNLQEGFSSEDLDIQFKKMARRYPPQGFSEKFGRIREAAEFLRDIHMSLRSLIEEKNFDAEWLRPFVKKRDINKTDMSDRQFAVDTTRLLFRDEMFEMAGLFIDDIDMDDDEDYPMDIDPEIFDDLFKEFAKDFQSGGVRRKKRKT